MIHLSEKLKVKSEKLNLGTPRILGYVRSHVLTFNFSFFTFHLFEPYSVAECDSIPSPIRWAISGNLEGKEDVGLGNKKTERIMC